MICAALLSDPGTKQDSAGEKKWGKARLGQTLLLVEVVSRIREVRLEKEKVGGSASSADVDRQGDSELLEIARFVTTLEARLGVLLEAKVNYFS